MKTTTIQQTVVIPATTPEEVYDALLDSKTHTALTGSFAKISAKIGGAFTAWDGYISGKNLELEQGRRIVQERVTTGWPKNASPSRVTINLLPIKQGTEISLLQENVPAKDATAYDQGWHDYYWKPMVRFFQK
ncbi:MAG: SRPBCC domain-containing protein [Coprothermobacterota bacterium]|nr:SRPBCC domain-containing protein [Coprothermobacterota bacterium]